MSDDQKVLPDPGSVAAVDTLRIEITIDGAGQLKVEAHGLADGWTCASLLLAGLGAVLNQIKSEADGSRKIVIPRGLSLPNVVLPHKNRG